DHSDDIWKLLCIELRFTVTVFPVIVDFNVRTVDESFTFYPLRILNDTGLIDTRMVLCPSGPERVQQHRSVRSTAWRDWIMFPQRPFMYVLQVRPGANCV